MADDVKVPLRQKMTLTSSSGAELALTVDDDSKGFTYVGIPVTVSGLAGSVDLFELYKAVELLLRLRRPHEFR